MVRFFLIYFILFCFIFSIISAEINLKFLIYYSGTHLILS